MWKKLESSVFSSLGQSEETFDYKFGLFSRKRAWDLVLSSENYLAFIISNENSLKLSEIDRNFNTFDFLQSILSHFLLEVWKYFFKNLLIMSSVFVLLNFCQHFDSKTIQNVHKLHKNENVETSRLPWSHSQVFFKQNTATFSWKNVMQAFFRFSVV